MLMTNRGIEGSPKRLLTEYKDHALEGLVEYKVKDFSPNGVGSQLGVLLYCHSETLQKLSYDQFNQFQLGSDQFER